MCGCTHSTYRFVIYDLYVVFILYSLKIGIKQSFNTAIIILQKRKQLQYSWSSSRLKEGQELDYNIVSMHEIIYGNVRQIAFVFYEL